MGWKELIDTKNTSLWAQRETNRFFWRRVCKVSDCFYVSSSTVLRRLEHNKVKSMDGTTAFPQPLVFMYQHQNAWEWWCCNWNQQAWSGSSVWIIIRCATWLIFFSHKNQHCFYAVLPPNFAKPNTIRDERPQTNCWNPSKPVPWPILLLTEDMWQNPIDTSLRYAPFGVWHDQTHSYQNLYNWQSDPILRVYRYAPSGAQLHATNNRKSDHYRYTYGDQVQGFKVFPALQSSSLQRFNAVL